MVAEEGRAKQSRSLREEEKQYARFFSRLADGTANWDPERRCYVDDDDQPFMPRGTVIVAEDQLYAQVVPDQDGERFARLFREVWQSLPDDVRASMMRHWAEEPEAFEGVGAAQAPGIFLVTCGFHGRYAHTRAGGYRMEFFGEHIKFMPDPVMKTVIARQLAHAYLDIGRTSDMMTSLRWTHRRDDQVEVEATELMQTWGYESDNDGWIGDLTDEQAEDFFEWMGILKRTRHGSKEDIGGILIVLSKPDVAGKLVGVLSELAVMIESLSTRLQEAAHPEAENAEWLRDTLAELEVPDDREVDPWRLIMKVIALSALQAALAEAHDQMADCGWLGGDQSKEAGRE